jgi:hypothetical protein
VWDGALTDTGTVTVTVMAVNDAPVATAGASTTAEDTAVTITLAGTDVEGDALTFTIVAGPATGSLGAITQLTPTTASVTYTPNANSSAEQSDQGRGGGGRREAEDQHGGRPRAAQPHAVEAGEDQHHRGRVASHVGRERVDPFGEGGEELGRRADGGYRDEVVAGPFERLVDTRDPMRDRECERPERGDHDRPDQQSAPAESASERRRGDHGRDPDGDRRGDPRSRVQVPLAEQRCRAERDPGAAGAQVGPPDQRGHDHERPERERQRPPGPAGGAHPHGVGCQAFHPCSVAGADYEQRNGVIGP